MLHGYAECYFQARAMKIMRKKKILVLFLLLTFPGFSHDIKMAIFEVSQGKSGLQLDIVLDKEDFLKTLS